MPGLKKPKQKLLRNNNNGDSKSKVNKNANRHYKF